MLAIKNLYNFLFDILLLGGIGFIVGSLIHKNCHKKTHDIISYAILVLIVIMLIANMFGVPQKVFKPKMDERLYSYAESVIATIDTAAETDMPMKNLVQSLYSWTEAYSESNNDRTALEEQIYQKLWQTTYFVEEVYQEELSNRNGVEYNEYGFPIDWSDIGYDEDNIINLRNDLAELLRLPMYSDKNT